MQNNVGLTGLIARTSHLYRMKLNSLMNQNNIDLSSEMCGVLIELWKMDGRSQQELADTLHKDKGGMAKIISGLEQRKLIIRPVNDSDRRQKIIQLTQKGKRIRQKVEPLINELRKSALKNLNSNDLQHADSVLNAIIHNLHQTDLE